MTTRSIWYTSQCIASSGLAVMDRRIAYQLRPDLWAGLQDCAMCFRTQQNVAGAEHLVATFPRYGDVEIYARSRDNLEQRLQWIVGEQPTQIVEWQPAAPEVTPAQALKREADKRQAERLNALREIAAEDPPSHDCSRRREIIAARHELGMA